MLLKILFKPIFYMYWLILRPIGSTRLSSGIRTPIQESLLVDLLSGLNTSSLFSDCLKSPTRVLPFLSVFFQISSSLLNKLSIAVCQGLEIRLTELSDFRSKLQIAGLIAFESFNPSDRIIIAVFSFNPALVLCSDPAY